MENLFIFIQQEILLVTALIVLVALFLRKESSAGGNRLSLNETVQAMNSDSALLVDLRDSKEFSAGHISGAMNIPFNKLTDNAGQLEKHKDKQIILVDKMGQQAGSAGKQLNKKGFNVARMSGGMEEWRHQNMPVVK